MKRRDFIKKAVIAGSVLSFPHIWLKNAGAQKDLYKITLLQTNDTHSRIEPFPMDGGRFQGMGGMARRANLVNRIRRQNPDTLLLDAGDVLQGTPYFNIYKGRIEYETMSQCGYDATTLGNHEFDNGVEDLAQALQYANFDIVNCNFDFGNSPLLPLVKTFITRQVGRIKVGITGVGINFQDLVSRKNHQGVTFVNPYKPVQTVVNYLRKDLDCSLIVVLSHLGYRYDSSEPSDVEMAYRVNGIDWIVGGHTHTFMKEPEVVISKRGHTTRILQVGWAGVLVGKSDFYFEDRTLVAVKSHNLAVEKFTGELTSQERHA